MATATIYQIKCRETGQVYVGCTTIALDVRIYNHMHQKTNHISSYEILQRGKYDVEVLEKCPSDIKSIREEYWIKAFGDRAVNKLNAGKLRAQKEATTEREKYNREYYAKNRDKLTAKIKCEECGGMYCKLSRWQHINTKRHIRAALEQEELKADLEAMVEEIKL